MGGGHHSRSDATAYINDHRTPRCKRATAVDGANILALAHRRTCEWDGRGLGPVAETDPFVGREVPTRGLELLCLPLLSG